MQSAFSSNEALPKDHPHKELSNTPRPFLWEAKLFGSIVKISLKWGHVKDNLYKALFGPNDYGLG